MATSQKLLTKIAEDTEALRLQCLEASGLLDKQPEKKAIYQAMNNCSATIAQIRKTISELEAHTKKWAPAFTETTKSARKKVIEEMKTAKAEIDKIQTGLDKLFESIREAYKDTRGG